MKSLLKVLCAAAVAGLCVVSNLKAADSPAGGRRENIEQQIKEKLGLTEDQGRQIKAQLAGERDTIKDIVTRLAAARGEVREVIQKSGATEADVRKAAAKVGEVETELALFRFKVYGKIEAILTGDQKDKLKELNGGADQFINRLVERAARAVR